MATSFNKLIESEITTRVMHMTFSNNQFKLSLNKSLIYKIKADLDAYPDILRDNSGEFRKAFNLLYNSIISNEETFIQKTHHNSLILAMKKYYEYKNYDDIIESIRYSMDNEGYLQCRILYKNYLSNLSNLSNFEEYAKKHPKMPMILLSWKSIKDIMLDCIR